MKTNILKTSFSALVACSIWFQIDGETLTWPVRAYGEESKNQVTSAFGPRGGNLSWFHVGVDIQHLSTSTYKWDLLNPYKETCKILGSDGTTGDEQWICYSPSSATSTCPVKRVFFWHIDNTTLPADWQTKTYVAGALLPVKMKSINPNHCHFETLPVLTPAYTSNIYEARKMLTKNPLGYLAYDNTYAGAWGYSSSSPSTPQTSSKRYMTWTTGTDPANGYQYLKVTIAQHKRALIFNDVSLNVLNTAYYQAFRNNVCEYDLDYRLGSVFADMSSKGTSANTYRNTYYLGSKVDAPEWGMTDAEKKIVHYYFYPIPSWTSGTQFTLTLGDVDGKYWTSSSFIPNSCVGCTPPAEAPAPPTTLTAVTVPNGVQLNWSAVNFGESSGGYKIYRRPATSTNVLDAIPIVLVDKYKVTYTDILTDLNGIEAGFEYLYSIAAVNCYGEGCNGPFSTPGCTTWKTSGCSSCPFTEARVAMPSAYSITGTISQDTKTRFPVTVQNATITAGTGITRNLASRSQVRILPTTTITSSGTGVVRIYIDPAI